MTELDVRAARPDQYVAGQKGDWEIIIGLEVHAQVSSKAKLFSGASAAYGGAPNAHVSLVDAAMPGMLPVINKFCVEQAIRTGLGLNAQINKKSRFDRKNYFYPDLPQGYQISQFQMPIVGEGWVEFDSEREGMEPEKIRIERLHLEQDAGKSIHDLSPSETYVDLNRAGVALMEIVSRPDIRSAKEAAAYFNKVRAILRALGTCDGNMEEGSMRADVNVSVRRPGSEFGTRCEIKNVNSTRFMMQAIEFEARRQIEILESGGKIDQETRLFDANTGETRTMRSKEDAHDYRYFPDPDLLPLVIEQKWIEEIRASLPELPDAARKRAEGRYFLTPYQARVVSAHMDVVDAFDEAILRACEKKFGRPEALRMLATRRTWRGEMADEISEALLAEPGYDDGKHDAYLMGLSQSVANMIQGQLFAYATERQLEPAALVGKLDFGGLYELIINGTINGKIAKDVFVEMMETGKDAETIVNDKGLRQLDDRGAIEKAIDDLMAANADKVADVQKNPKAFGWWVGQTMKATGGKANPAVVNEILKKKLGV